MYNEDIRFDEKMIAKHYIILNRLFYIIEILCMFVSNKSYRYGGDSAGNMPNNNR